MKPGKRNLITDIDGLLVGNAEDQKLKSGVTVLTADKSFTAAVHVMGGAPGSRETDLLAPDKLVQQVDALVLSGGSAFGLDAASGVADGLRDLGRGFEVGPVRVPIVPGAILFDLLNGGDKNWVENPYKGLGQTALSTRDVSFSLGSVGAGTGGTTMNLKGGLGSASLVLDSGITVGALVATNPHGSVISDRKGAFWAAPFEFGDEFGARGTGTGFDPGAETDPYNLAPVQGSNTTIAIVATDADLTQAQATRMATAAHDGMTRAICPSHTPFDGDLVFAAATAAKKMSDPITDPLLIGHAAATCLARAIARSVYLAKPFTGDTLATWSQEFG